jgi:hypothetical protein
VLLGGAGGQRELKVHVRTGTGMATWWMLATSTIRTEEKMLLNDFFLFLSVYGHRHTPSPRISNLEDLGLSTRRAMTRHIRMGVLLNRQA